MLVLLEKAEAVSRVIVLRLIGAFSAADTATAVDGQRQFPDQFDHQAYSDWAYRLEKIKPGNLIELQHQ